jgi:hypothetical protein
LTHIGLQRRQAAGAESQFQPAKLDNRFHETSSDGTDDLLADSSFAIG